MGRWFVKAGFMALCPGETAARTPDTPESTQLWLRLEDGLTELSSAPMEDVPSSSLVFVYCESKVIQKTGTGFIEGKKATQKDNSELLLS